MSNIKKTGKIQGTITMKRISETELEYNCIIKSVNTITLTKSDDAETTEAIIHYFDTEDEINLVVRGNYYNESIQRLYKKYLNNETIKLTLTVNS